MINTLSRMANAGQIFVVALLVMLVTTGQAHAQRVALVIGNATYKAGPLTNPPNDVREMEKALRSVGFKVETVLNANQSQMKRALRDFGEQAEGAELAFFYFSGHGTQANGENYLIPTDATIKKQSDYDIEAVGANGLMRQISSARPKAAIVVLDACRDNPYPAITKSTTKGLARMDAPTDSMIAFATAANATASDDGNYARILARNLATPSVELYDVFRNTSEEVKRLSNGQQVPRVSEVSITTKIYLAGTGQGIGSLAPTTAVARPVKANGVSSAPTGIVTGRPLPGTRLKDCDVCPELVVLPTGSFEMGSPRSELHSEQNEKPVHQVTIGREIAVGRYEVTQGEWMGVMGINPSHFSAREPGYPVDHVSWEDAQAYLIKLNERTGNKFGFRLLSESEWEYACRGGTNTTFSTGDTITMSQANFNGGYTSNGSAKGEFRKRPTKVGSFPPNAYGLYDMHGNLWEWVEEGMHNDYNGAPNDGSAWVGQRTSYRVIRGGSWQDSSGSLRAANRADKMSSSTFDGVGFRIARTLP